MLPILQLDRSGQPSAWINHHQAISMMASDRVLDNLGSDESIFKGGHNRLTGERSQIIVGTILLTTERVRTGRLSSDYIVPYSNRILFARDNFICQYCGNSFSPYLLSRDHVHPRSRGGSDSWTNSVTCCKRCNHAKGSRTPEEWGHLLLAVPFAPSWSEFMYLKNRKRIVLEQFDYLRNLFPVDSVLREGISFAA